MPEVDGVVIGILTASTATGQLVFLPLLANLTDHFGWRIALGLMCGMIGHGDSFVLRDPNGIRPAFYYRDDEVVVVASERPVIQTVFNVPSEAV